MIRDEIGEIILEKEALACEVKGCEDKNCDGGYYSHNGLLGLLAAWRLFAYFSLVEGIITNSEKVVYCTKV